MLVTSWYHVDDAGGGALIPV
ncbi:protein of unknown function [Trichlorobacter ammonificans]|uniref:Uncharacterized protein n=1 Tax=Trichlorobacter ammonificans TaxID=2916410 RepID=A0ABM9DAQ6_9BACT|nr:protein of unknown function [Trichlorobacter ammonificans]